jgi:hypothetical protein
MPWWQGPTYHGSYWTYSH